MQALQSWKTAAPRMRQFYKGGFLSEMTRREAAMVLGVRSPERGATRLRQLGAPALAGGAQPPAHALGRPRGADRSPRHLRSPAGVRESAPEEKVKEAHRRIMIANHPDSGGSSFVAAKVNEAKDILLGKKRPGGPIF